MRHCVTLAYHPSCAAKFPIAPNGGFKKCCGPPSPLPAILLTITPPPTDDLRTLIREELKFVRYTFTAEFHNLNTSIASLSSDMRAVNTKIDACVTETHFTTVRVDALKNNVDELMQGNFSSNVDFDSCLLEVEDRLRSRKNLIIFGLNDHDHLSLLTRRFLISIHYNIYFLLCYLMCQLTS